MEDFNYELFEETKYRVEKDKSLIYNSETDEDICCVYDEEKMIFLLNLLNKYG